MGTTNRSSDPNMESLISSVRGVSMNENLGTPVKTCWTCTNIDWKHMYWTHACWMYMYWAHVDCTHAYVNIPYVLDSYVLDTCVSKYAFMDTPHTCVCQHVCIQIHIHVCQHVCIQIHIHVSNTRDTRTHTRTHTPTSTPASTPP